MSTMFKRSFATGNRDSGKVSKPPSKFAKPSKRSFTHQARMKLQQLTMDGASPSRYVCVREGACGLHRPDNVPSPVQSPVITVVVGPEGRLFACHTDVLSQSSFFAAVIRGQFYEAGPARRIELPDEEPEVFSAILEFMYKGDYYPRLLHQDNKLKRSSWTLEGTQTADVPAANNAADNGSNKTNGSSTLYHGGIGGVLLKDTAVYCAADRYGLAELQRIALRKQGLRTGIPVDVILRSARYAYENTPEQDAKLRAHFLALIIRSRRTFKRSGTMQMEMEAGGSRLFFDLFVAMCNHIDDITELTSKASPRTV